MKTAIMDLSYNNTSMHVNLVEVLLPVNRPLCELSVMAVLFVRLGFM